MKLGQTKLRAALVLLFGLGATACPDGAKGSSQRPASTCKQRGEQCQLPGGVLGVCNDGACPAGREPPCLACTPQH
ncbi:MAG: hypothetical protein IPI67_06045 [Myxococcales bacterium]|nr:hypothetical protein [Myxococcales bacterium]